MTSEEFGKLFKQECGEDKNHSDLIPWILIAERAWAKAICSDCGERVIGRINARYLDNRENYLLSKTNGLK